MANEDIKKSAKENNIYLWEIANELGYTDATFSRKLRFEFNPKEKKHIAEIIEMLVNKKMGDEFNG